MIFFAADGLRQDQVEAWAGKKSLPAFDELLNHGVAATDGGLLTQAPPNTGAGWYSLATGAWPGVHGSTNNTFSINGQFTSRKAAFDAGVLQAETIAQSAERGGKKVAQIEWAGGRVGVINGPTVDFRTFFSGRGVTTNYIAPVRQRSLHGIVRAPVRPSGGVRRPAGVPGRRSGDRLGMDERAGVVTARRRRCACASSTSASTSTA